MNSATATVESSVPDAPVAPVPRNCQNCGTPMLGEYCHACGQPSKGMIRPLSSMLHDVADTIFNIDSRIFRTLGPLYVRPGYLTCEYFAGRRVRYVTPFRLYFFLSVIAFFAAQFALSDVNMNNAVISDGAPEIGAAQTSEEVEKARDDVVAQLNKLTGPAAGGAEQAIKNVNRKAEKRLAYLQRAAEAKARGEPPPIDKSEDSNDLSFNDIPWDAQKNPVRVAWLPVFANDRLNAAIGHMKDNLPRIRKDPKPFLLGAFGMLAQVLFVLMPLFALLLKIFYIFKRRLYMEHVMVALHSHSFIFLSLLLITLAGLASSAVSVSAPWLSALLGWVIFALGWWLPIYLLIMQKRVYRQGWFMTVIKYLAIGICYTILVSFGIVAALIISLATT